MSKAPGSPSFRPPNNERLRMKFSSLNLSPPAVSPPIDQASSTEGTPAAEVVDKTIVDNNVAAVERQETSRRLSIPIIARPRSNSRPELPRVTSGDDDIYQLDDEGWSRVANAQGIEEMVPLGEGVSGSVSKCRLRKSGQIFAIKVLSSTMPR